MWISTTHPFLLTWMPWIFIYFGLVRIPPHYLLPTITWIWEKVVINNGRYVINACFLFVVFNFLIWHRYLKYIYNHDNNCLILTLNFKTFLIHWQWLLFTIHLSASKIILCNLFFKIWCYIRNILKSTRHSAQIYVSKLSLGFPQLKYVYYTVFSLNVQFNNRKSPVLSSSMSRTCYQSGIRNLSPLNQIILSPRVIHIIAN